MCDLRTATSLWVTRDNRIPMLNPYDIFGSGSPCSPLHVPSQYVMRAGASTKNPWDPPHAPYVEIPRNNENMVKDITIRSDQFLVCCPCGHASITAYATSDLLTPSPLSTTSLGLDTHGYTQVWTGVALPISTCTPTHKHSHMCPFRPLPRCLTFDDCHADESCPHILENLIARLCCSLSCSWPK